MESSASKVVRQTGQLLPSASLKGTVGRPLMLSELATGFFTTSLSRRNNNS